MKKLFAVILAVALMLALSVVAYAADEVEIPLDADHVGQSSTGGAETVTIGDNSITANDIALFDLILPEKVALGETVVVHIKGSSDGDFRVWLLADGKTDEKGVEITFSNQWKGSENGFSAPGEFEKYIELTAEDYDAQSMTEADRVAFKGPSFGTNLANLTINYVGIIKGSIADVEATTVTELQPLADKAANALANIRNTTDTEKVDNAAIEAALAEAQSALDELNEKNTFGFPGVAGLVKIANDSVKELESILEGAAATDALLAIQPSVDAVNAALADAKAAGEDIEKLEAALTAAKTAADEVAKSAEENGYKDVKDAASAASESVKEIEKLLTAAKDAKAQAEAAAAKAAEEAAAKKKTTTIIVVAVVAVVVIIAVVVAIIAKKKKK